MLEAKLIRAGGSSLTFNLSVWWPGVVLLGAAAVISSAAQCEAAKALCLCIQRLISSQRRCVPTTPRSSSALPPSAFPCALDGGPNPQPPARPAPPAPRPLLSEDIEKEKGPGLMCN